MADAVVSGQTIHAESLMPIWGWVCVGLTAAVVLLIVFAIIYAIIGDARDRRRYEREAEEFVGWIVYAHPDLYTPVGQTSEVQVLVTFDGEPGMPDLAIAQLAARIAKFGQCEPTTDDGAAVAKVMREKGCGSLKWFLIPPSLSGGREVYLLRVWFERSMLPGKALRLPFIRCLLFRNQPDTRVLMTRYQPSDDSVQVPELPDDLPVGAVSQSPDTAQPSRPSIRDAAYRLRAQNVPPEEACRVLIEEEGYPAAQVDSIIKEIWGRQTSGQGCGQVAIGGVLLAVGLGITIYTFQKAEGGGTYVVMTGFIISGIWNILRGLVRMGSDR